MASAITTQPKAMPTTEINEETYVNNRSSKDYICCYFKRNGLFDVCACLEDFFTELCDCLNSFCICCQEFLDECYYSIESRDAWNRRNRNLNMNERWYNDRNEIDYSFVTENDANFNIIHDNYRDDTGNNEECYVGDSIGDFCVEESSQDFANDDCGGGDSGGGDCDGGVTGGGDCGGGDSGGGDCGGGDSGGGDCGGGDCCGGDSGGGDCGGGDSGGGDCGGGDSGGGDCGGGYD